MGAHANDCASVYPPTQALVLDPQALVFEPDALQGQERAELIRLTEKIADAGDAGQI